MSYAIRTGNIIRRISGTVSLTLRIITAARRLLSTHWSKGAASHKMHALVGYPACAETPFEIGLPTHTSRVLPQEPGLTAKCTSYFLPIHTSQEPSLDCVLSWPHYSLVRHTIGADLTLRITRPLSAITKFNPTSRDANEIPLCIFFPLKANFSFVRSLNSAPHLAMKLAMRSIVSYYYF